MDRCLPARDQSIDQKEANGAREQRRRHHQQHPNRPVGHTPPLLLQPDAMVSGSGSICNLPE
jgi:hypothetical protein